MGFIPDSSDLLLRGPEYHICTALLSSRQSRSAPGIVFAKEFRHSSVALLIVPHWLQASLNGHAAPAAASPPVTRAGRIPAGEFKEKDWHIKTKTADTIKPFGGLAERYGEWSEQIKDHLNLSQSGWLRILQLLEQEPFPMTSKRMTAFPHVDGVKLDLV